VRRHCPRGPATTSPVPGRGAGESLRGRPEVTLSQRPSRGRPFHRADDRLIHLRRDQMALTSRLQIGRVPDAGRRHIAYDLRGPARMGVRCGRVRHAHAWRSGHSD
jgi:hypothetical protein